ncbi:MAG: GTP 3',8-cyclase MoaA [Deltaproteobacteria bacterium]|nr:GTP 3',8-cyclase MoaA [Deltaproteobacteria bacterium]
MTDTFGRRIDNLRISVTDRCNFRCRYCMPPEGIRWVPHKEVLRFEEITTVARNFLALGGRKIRLTGGEPLLRSEIEILVRQLAALPGLEDLSLTTNGALLAGKAHALWDAGLRRINISLDTLNPLRFQWVCLRDALREVWAGFEAACAVGFGIKLNSVVLAGVTEAEVCELIDLAVERGIEVRFIEFMPLCGSGWSPDLWFSMDTVRNWLMARWRLLPLERGSAPAQSYAIEGTRARVGFIESLSKPFCGDCARVRLTATGKLRLCLFSPLEYDLRPYLYDDAALQSRLQEAIVHKPAGHAAHTVAEWQGETMPRIQVIGG